MLDVWQTESERERESRRCSDVFLLTPPLTTVFNKIVSKDEFKGLVLFQ